MLTWLSRHVFFPLWEIKDGAHRASYLRELLRTQWLPAGVLLEKQWEKTREMVAYAIRNCPYYQQSLAPAAADGRIRSWEDFKRLPTLAKSDIRTNGEALISREFRRSELVEARTGGSTGTALQLFFDHRCQELRNAAAMRSDMWAGWDIGMRVAAVWGNPPVMDTTKKRIRNALLDRTMYLDTMEMSEQSVRDFIAEWQRKKPRILFGHSHSLYVLAVFLRRLGLDRLRPRGIISTSMMLLDAERRIIEEVFGCPVTNRYGCEEVSLIASECERHDGMHLNADHVVVEFLRSDGSDAAPGEEGEIVVTDLVNRGMPFIRYRVEDMGVPIDRRCGCGRGLPMMDRVTGRVADFLKKPDGSLVAGVSLVERTLTAIAGIEQMQLVQNRLDAIDVIVVGDSAYGPDTETALRHELGTVFGADVSIQVRRQHELERTRSGKYRFAICNV